MDYNEYITTEILRGSSKQKILANLRKNGCNEQDLKIYDEFIDIFQGLQTEVKNEQKHAVRINYKNIFSGILFIAIGVIRLALIGTGNTFNLVIVGVLIISGLVFIISQVRGRT